MERRKVRDGAMVRRVDEGDDLFGERRDVEGDDATIVCMALNGYANWIETGDFLLSAADAEQRKKKFNALSTDQMRRVVRLRELAQLFLQHSGSGERVVTTRSR